LLGSGLALRTNLFDQVQPASNGVFTFPTRVADGSNYSVAVITQPTNPALICTVGNGGGKIAGADITNVTVNCVAPAVNGALDPAYGSAGKVSNALPPISAMALQSDGKLLAVGAMTLSRYNTDGSTDSSFGSSGKVTIVANGGATDAMRALAVQTDGKIVVVGDTTVPAAVYGNMVVLRYNPNGSLDTSFGSDGKIIVAGSATLSVSGIPDQDVALVRYLSNGALDTGFGAGGKITTSIAGKSDFGYAIALQADGKVIVAGRVGVDGGSNPDFGVVRYLANGSLDTSFGTSGVTRIEFTTGGWAQAGDIAIQADGKIVIGGFAQVSGKYRYALVRLLSSGLADTSFGTLGLVSTSFSGQNDYGRALALQSDGKIVVAGQVASIGANPNFGIARYLTSGGLDAAFGTAGLVEVDFFGAIDNANDVLVQGDGKIVVGGSARNGGTTGLGIARVLP
jgi:uncharacterized delta-60 repeat protein